MLQSPLREGDRVEVRGEDWVLTGLAPHGTCTIVTLRGCGPGNATETCDLVTPFDRPRVYRRRARWRRTRRARAVRAAAGVVAGAHPHAALRAAATARMTLLSWQLAPALAVVAGHPRVLVADEVGLGKTVQAGLVIAELHARGEAARVLVLTPAGLRAQWVRELDERFGLRAVLVDQARLARDRAALPRDVNPWSLHPLVVTSIDLIRQPEVLGAIDRLPVDLLVVDEAHHAAPGTERGHATARLAAHALRVLLLTATPHSGDEAAYRSLCSLGDLRPPAPPLVFRRTQSSVGLALPRRTHVLPVAPTADERTLFDALRRYLAWLSAESGDDARAPLLASVLARRAASGPYALARTIARRRALVGAPAPPDAQLCLPWDEPDPRDDCVPDAVVGLHLGVDAAREQRMLDGLLSRARCATAGGASKHGALARLLARIDEPAIVFTEYRDTLDELVSMLDARGPVAVLHGGLSRVEREAAVGAFVRGPARWLLATDAGSEGLNLHARCRVAINVDVPPGPTRLAQRAGRVARLGQTRRVHVFTLVHAGGLDEPALARFEDRQAAIDDALAANRLSSEPLVEGFHRAADREAGRVLSSRRLTKVIPASRASGRRATVPCGLRARRGTGRSWRLVVSADARDRSGRLVETMVVGVTAAWASAPPRAWPEVRKALAEILDELDRSGVFGWRAAALEAERGRAHEALMARAEILLARVSTGSGRYQPSLFDRRSVVAAAREARRRVSAAGWWEARIDQLRDARLPLHVDPPALRAAYVDGRLR